jgi:hypothetical protein
MCIVAHLFCLVFWLMNFFSSPIDQVQVPAQNLWEPSNPNTPMAARDAYASNGNLWYHIWVKIKWKLTFFSHPVNAQGRGGLSLDAFGFRTAHTSTSALDASAETSNPFNHLGCMWIVSLLCFLYSD